MIVAVLAVLKAGGAYVPLDPSYPAERLSFMLADACPRVLLTERSLTAALPAHGARVVLVNEDWPEVARNSAENVNDAGVADSLAYVIYTSGSAGRPKGVAVTHRSLSNFLASMQRRPGLSEEDGLLALTTLSFDIAALELYLPLVTGARLVLASREEAADARLLAALIESSGASVVQATPATWRMLIESGWKGREGLKVLCGGEALEVGLAVSLSERAGEVWNMYGPTETTIWSGAVRLNKEARREWRGGVMPVGGPIANTTFYVLDNTQQLVPVGVAGELCIGGDGLARGYLRRPALTAERFIPDQFSARPGARLYRTGDLARWLTDGHVEFLGRLDHQVKVRGYRIELGEVESALRGHESVADCVVTAREDTSGEKRLIAYVVAAAGDGGRGASIAGLRTHLRERLPEYMVPSAFVVLDELPLTPNGKVDRRALPAPDSAGESAEYAAPRTEVEEALTRVCSELLRVERVGVKDDFFELGGHSLLATQVVSRLRAAFGVELPLRALFANPSIEALAREVERARGGLQTVRGVSIVRAHREAPLPLSFGQRRLWLWEQMNPGTPTYNVAGALRLTGQLDIGALGRGLDEIARRHEVLRTSFETAGGELVQVVNAESALPLTRVDLSGLAAEAREREAQRLAAEEAESPFDLARAPLLRSSLLQLSEEEHVLLLTAHHIVSDGWSISILLRELFTLYGAYARGEGSPLAELTVQYADYAVWQRGREGEEEFARQLGYWRARLAGAPPVVGLPADRPRPSKQGFEGARHAALLSAGAVAGLKELARAEGTTLFAALLSGLGLLLKLKGAGEDIVVGTDASGRVSTEVEGLIGFFTNQLALRTDLSGDPTVGELLRRAGGATLEAQEHQDVPFERVVEELGTRRDPALTPIFQVKLVMAGGDAVEALEEAAAAGLHVSGFESGGAAAAARFDVTVFAEEEPSGALRLTWEYSTALYTAGGIERVARELTLILGGMAEGGAARRVGELAAEAAEAAERERQCVASEARRSGRERLRMLKRRTVAREGRAEGGL
jgi:amino acid adenylation domain-containing protein